jgi:hypothetical protein
VVDNIVFSCSGSGAIDVLAESPAPRAPPPPAPHTPPDVVDRRVAPARVSPPGQRFVGRGHRGDHRPFERRRGILTPDTRATGRSVDSLPAARQAAG